MKVFQGASPTLRRVDELHTNVFITYFVDSILIYIIVSPSYVCVLYYN
jgi:hypothetical protein